MVNPAPLRILYVGPMDGGATCLQRMRAMFELGHDVVPIDTNFAAGRGALQHLNRVLNRLRNRQWGAPVSFIGTYEGDRARSLNALARAGFPVRVWGGDWTPMPNPDRALTLENRPVYADQYATAMCGSDINLCFLRKMNRDQQTQRSVEIPACGGFMLAERTAEHQALFEEGTQAEYFSSDEELIEKVRHYLANPAERKKIALAGRQRCVDSGYSNHDRIATMLQTAVALRPGR